MGDQAVMSYVSQYLNLLLPIILGWIINIDRRLSRLEGGL